MVIIAECNETFHQDTAFVTHSHIFLPMYIPYFSSTRQSTHIFMPIAYIKRKANSFIYGNYHNIVSLRVHRFLVFNVPSSFDHEIIQTLLLTFKV